MVRGVKKSTKKSKSRSKSRSKSISKRANKSKMKSSNKMNPEQAELLQFEKEYEHVRSKLIKLNKKGLGATPEAEKLIDQLITIQEKVKNWIVKNLTTSRF